MQTHTTVRRHNGVPGDRSSSLGRSNRVYKSLHKPLTYRGVERTLFYFVCVGAPSSRRASSHPSSLLYAQAVTSNKRAAQSKVVKTMVPNVGAIRVQTPIPAGR
jgi:hypothetical protein